MSGDSHCFEWHKEPRLFIYFCDTVEEILILVKSGRLLTILDIFIIHIVVSQYFFLNNGKL